MQIMDFYLHIYPHAIRPANRELLRDYWYYVGDASELLLQICLETASSPYKYNINEAALLPSNLTRFENKMRICLGAEYLRDSSQFENLKYAVSSMEFDLGL